jgi:hypothetical protein
MTANATENLMTRSLLDVFNERDPHRRATAISEVYSPTIAFYEQDGVATGPAALDERVQQLLDGAPGFVFAPVGRPIVNHGMGRQPWTFGPPAGTPAVTGTDIARLADGRIQALYVFVDPTS